MGGSFALDIVLTIALAFTGAHVMNNADKLKQVQKVTNNEVLCPLYEIFIQASKAPPPAPSPGEAREGYEKRMTERAKALKTISEGYDILECNGGMKR